MKELKTLKDFKRKQYSEGEDKKGNKVRYIDERELKAEAVKWVKEMEILTKTADDYIYECLTGNKITYSEEGKQAIKNFIKHFFNLTDEDLTKQGGDD